jgi:formylglycine-generating enzyme
MRPRNSIRRCAGLLASLAIVSPCAAGEAAEASPRLCAAYSGLPEGTDAKAGLAFVPGGAFVMGSDRQQPEERSTHIVRVDGFWIDRHEVTNVSSPASSPRPITSRSPSAG